MENPLLSSLLTASNKALFSKSNESDGREVVGDFQIEPIINFTEYTSEKSISLRFVRQPKASGASADIRKAYSSDNCFPSSTYPLAVKKMHFSKILRSPEEQHDRSDYYVLLQREIKAVKEICFGADTSIFVTRYFGSFFQFDFVENWLIFEFCQGGDLKFLSTLEVNLDYLAAITANILSALQVVHEIGFIHADLKPDNLLLAAPGIVKICDFGLAAKFKEEEDPELHALGTTRYMSPELMKRNVYLDDGNPLAFECFYEYKTDVWSVGVLLLEFLIGFCPLFHLRKLSRDEGIYCDYIKNMTKRIPRNSGSGLAQMLHLRPGYREYVVNAGRNPDREKLQLVSRCKALRAYGGDVRELVLRPHLRDIRVDPSQPVPNLSKPGCYRLNLFADFIAQCLICFAENRPSVEELKMHPFVKKQCQELDTITPVLKANEFLPARQLRRALKGTSTILTLDACQSLLKLREDQQKTKLGKKPFKSRFTFSDSSQEDLI